MDAEIELKLFIQQQDHDLLIKILNELPNSSPQGTKKLSNGYFDTTDLQLRRWDMGLRVRGFDDQLEQTIKTAGSVVGGIHSRPEYNVSIVQKVPDLSLFPNKIWPDKQNIAVINTALECIFETNFNRQTWHINVDDSIVEVALDIGEIIANGKIEPICELEFELLSGHASALLPLAIAVAQSVPLRLGKASKALRGYQLAGKSKPVATTPLDAMQPFSHDNAHSIQNLAMGLERWQLIEQRLAVTSTEQQTLLWVQLTECIEFLKHTVSLDTEKTHPLHTLFNHILETLPRVTPPDNSPTNAVPSEQLARLWRLPQYGQLQLALVNRLISAAK
ncbi:inorganic triphosphatase [Shewanella sp. MF05960]|uniref:CYTH domain-containing protein n=1 Tax=Shewanella sp. MF05960 TaxID=3434874 RepID=UPI003D79AAE7